MEGGSVFVICPFGDPYDAYYRDVYGAAIVEAGYSPLRADDIFTAGNVVGQIVESISDAVLVLADLSLPNANVYYELGIAHAFGRPSILVTDDLAGIPFDLRNLRHQGYDVRQPDWATQLREELCLAIKETASKPSASILAPLIGNGDSAEPESLRGGTADMAPQLAMLQASIDSLRLDMHRRVTGVADLLGDVPATERELSRAAAKLIEKGVAPTLVVESLRARGAPTPWARMTVGRLADHGR